MLEKLFALWCVQSIHNPSILKSDTPPTLGTAPSKINSHTDEDNDDDDAYRNPSYLSSFKENKNKNSIKYLKKCAMSFGK